MTSCRTIRGASGSPAPPIEELIKRGWLGEKSGQGFYRRVGKGADEHRGAGSEDVRIPAAKRAAFPSVDQARNIEHLPDRIRALVQANDRAGTFLWSLFSELFLYSAERIPEIAERVVEDRPRHALGLCAHLRAI